MPLRYALSDEERRAKIQAYRAPSQLLLSAAYLLMLAVLVAALGTTIFALLCTP